MKRQGLWASTHGGRSGTTTVELALLLPLLFTLLFGTVEIGFFVKNAAAVRYTAREAGRRAVTGATPSEIVAAARNAAPALKPGDLRVVVQKRSWDENANAWGAWQTLGEADGVNDAVRGDQIRVQVSYTHNLLMGRMFADVLAGGNTSIPVTGTASMMRE